MSRIAKVRKGSDLVLRNRFRFCGASGFQVGGVPAPIVSARILGGVEPFDRTNRLRCGLPQAFADFEEPLVGNNRRTHRNTSRHGDDRKLSAV